LPRCAPVVGQIAYVRADPNEKYLGHIWIMNADTTGKTQITFGSGDDDYPAWSADYKKVVFSTNRRGSYELFVVNADGTGLMPLTNTVNGSRDEYPSWTPDGTKIYFTRSVINPAANAWRSEIYSVNADGTGLTRVSNDRANLYEPAVSPDGKKLAVTRLASGSWADARIVTMNIDGTGTTLLTSNAKGDGNPAWAPNGTKLVFTCNIGYVTDRDICVVNADGTGRTVIVTTAGEQAVPTFSRDASRIVFGSFAQSPNGRLISIKPDGTGAVQLESNLDPMGYFSAAWSR
jgi:TolB protein